MRHLEYVWNLTRFAFARNPLLAASIAVSLASAGIELLAMSSLMPLFEIVAGGEPSKDSLVAGAISSLGFPLSGNALLWAFVILFALRLLTQIAGQTLSTFLGKRIMAQLCSSAFFQIIKNLSISEVNEKSVGFYISLAGDESFRASNLILSLTQFVSTAALALFYFLAIAAYSAPAAAFVAGFLLLAALAMVRIVRISHGLGARQTEESRRAGTLFLDSLNNIKAVRAFSAESYVVDMHRRLMFGYSRVLFWVDELALLTKLLPVLLLFVVFSVWLAWSETRIESIGIAFIVTMIVYLMRFFPVVGQGVTLMMRIASDAKSGRDVTAILPASVQSGPETGPALSRIEAINVVGLAFSYLPDGSKEVLRGVDLAFAKGKSYAIAGKSGYGKSTLVDILLRFYSPTGGEVLLNGVSIREFSDADIRQRIIVVSQESAIFDDSVTNNIRMGLPASEADVRRACDKACIRDLVESMPEAYETRLQYRGANLSGGQRQRFAIARALLRGPDVLVLDEATSALDKETQRVVLENILRDYADKIVILVTHDPYIMSRVDVVYDLEKINRVERSSS